VTESGKEGKRGRPRRPLEQTPPKERKYFRWKEDGKGRSQHREVKKKGGTGPSTLIEEKKRLDDFVVELKIRPISLAEPFYWQTQGKKEKRANSVIGKKGRGGSPILLFKKGLGIHMREKESLPNPGRKMEFF